MPFRRGERGLSVQLACRSRAVSVLLSCPFRALSRAVSGTKVCVSRPESHTWRRIRVVATLDLENQPLLRYIYSSEKGNQWEHL